MPGNPSGGDYEFAARQASDGSTPSVPRQRTMYEARMDRWDEQARVAVRHQGDGPVSGHLPESVAHAADNAQPNGRPSTLTCSNLDLVSRCGSPDTPTPAPPIWTPWVLSMPVRDQQVVLSLSADSGTCVTLLPVRCEAPFRRVAVPPFQRWQALAPCGDVAEGYGVRPETAATVTGAAAEA